MDSSQMSYDPEFSDVSDDEPIPDPIDSESFY